MLYLTTGGNGAGKTLLTLRDVREKSVKENRPVVYNGRFELTAEFGWKSAPFEKWQEEPDGTIFIVDECHNDIPTRTSTEKRPPHITMLAEHRRRGFDFYLITQHPLNIDSFVRRLISSPGWHRHLKRASGAPLVSVLTWAAVNDKAEKAGSGGSAAVAMVPYPKEVFAWYKSTSLDTAKVKIPFQVKLLIACVLLIPLLGWFGYEALMKKMQPKPLLAPTGASGAIGLAGAAPGYAPGQGAFLGAHVTAAEFVASHVPRIDGLAYTASRFDEVNKITQAPKPSACLATKTRCKCYTQQATVLQMPADLCRQIALGGYFDESAPIALPASIVAAAAPLVAPPAAVAADVRDGAAIGVLRARADAVKLAAK